MQTDQSSARSALHDRTAASSLFIRSLSGIRVLSQYTRCGAPGPRAPQRACGALGPLQSRLAPGSATTLEGSRVYGCACKLAPLSIEAAAAGAAPAGSTRPFGDAGCGSVLQVTRLDTAPGAGGTGSAKAFLEAGPRKTDDRACTGAPDGPAGQADGAVVVGCLRLGASSFLLLVASRQRSFGVRCVCGCGTSVAGFRAGVDASGVFYDRCGST